MLQTTAQHEFCILTAIHGRIHDQYEATTKRCCTFLPSIATAVERNSAYKIWSLPPMMVHIPNVLTKEQVARCRAVMERGDWADGRITAGHQSAQVKYNLQLPEDSLVARELGDMVMQTLARNNLFFSAVLPKQVFPPLFNRYDAGMVFGSHVDNAIREGSGVRIRTDVS